MVSPQYVSEHALTNRIWNEMIYHNHQQCIWNFSFFHEHWSCDHAMLSFVCTPCHRACIDMDVSLYVSACEHSGLPGTRILPRTLVQDRSNLYNKDCALYVDDHPMLLNYHMIYCTGHMENIVDYHFSANQPDYESRHACNIRLYFEIFCRSGGLDINNLHFQPLYWLYYHYYVSSTLFYEARGLFWEDKDLCDNDTSFFHIWPLDKFFFLVQWYLKWCLLDDGSSKSELKLE